MDRYFGMPTANAKISHGIMWNLRKTACDAVDLGSARVGSAPERPPARERAYWACACGETPAERRCDAGRRSYREIVRPRQLPDNPKGVLLRREERTSGRKVTDRKSVVPAQGAM